MSKSYHEILAKYNNNNVNARVGAAYKRINLRLEALHNSMNEKTQGLR